MKKIKLVNKIIAISISLLMVLSSFTMQNSMAFAATNDPLNNLKKYNKSDVKVDLNTKNNGEFFMSGTLSDKKIPSEKESLKFLDQNKTTLGLNNVLNNFKQAKLTSDSVGYTHIRLDQYISGLPVEGRQVTVHFNNKGIITAANGNAVSDAILTKLGNKNITASEAISIAKSQFKNINSISSLEPTAKKIALVIGKNVYAVYSVNIRYTVPTMGNWDVYVETSSGKVIDKQSNIRDAGTPVEGTGLGVDGKIKKLNLDLRYGEEYYMTDLTKPMLNSNDITTYDADNGDGIESYYYCSNYTGAFTTEYDKPLVDAHYNAGVVYDFYKNLFNRNSIDGEGMSIISVAHVGYNDNNAVWDGSAIYYGDGDGSKFTYFSGDIDVVGHEITHGVTQYNGDLYYHNQSGALDESVSDVFGVLIETYNKYNVKNAGIWQFNAADWVVGDEICTPDIPGDAARSLANPTLYGQPDNMDDYYNTPDDADNDNGGIHTNSGIPNKAAYLIAEAIGMAKTAKIYYGAYNYFNYTIDFTGAANAIMRAATDLYGASSTEVNAVKTAFTAVKVLPSPIVTFNSQGGSAVSSISADYNSIITAPVTPTKTGHTFGGWYKEAECLNAWNFMTDKVTTNTTLYAKWTINNYTVAFNSQGGSAVTSTTVDPNSTIIAPVTPTKTGYTFGGWYKEAGCLNVWDFMTDKVVANTTLYAKWTVDTLGIPINLKAVSSSYNSINISWSRAAGSTGYEVCRSTSSTGTYSIISTTTATSYNNTGLTTNRAYYYKVRAYRMTDSVKEYSDFSILKSAKPIPATPTKFKATRISSKSIKLTWSGVKGASGYKVYRAYSSKGTYRLLKTTKYLYYTNSGLTRGRTYYYKMRAYRTVGTTIVYSNWTNVVYAKP